MGWNVYLNHCLGVIIIEGAFNKFWVHIRPSSVFGVKVLWNESNTWLSTLNAYLEAIVEKEIANTSCAILARIEYLLEFTYYYVRISKLNFTYWILIQNFPHHLLMLEFGNT